MFPRDKYKCIISNIWTLHLTHPWWSSGQLTRPGGKWNIAGHVDASDRLPLNLFIKTNRFIVTPLVFTLVIKVVATRGQCRVRDSLVARTGFSSPRWLYPILDINKPLTLWKHLLVFPPKFQRGRHHSKSALNPIVKWKCVFFLITGVSHHVAAILCTQR